ncbi:MAG TPA: hypothetical protein VN380_21040 [Thermoanaerobaculia bacterium]|jgi:hypothetical protein|nr:hypothetical protein [Thermoanaerobaculia bacterium]
MSQVLLTSVAGPSVFGGERRFITREASRLQRTEAGDDLLLLAE